MRGVYISNVFIGFRNIPHMVVAVRHDLANGRFYVLRATLDTEQFNDLFSGLEVGGEGDVFVINRDGVLQTLSRYHGKLLNKADLSIPDYSERSQVMTLNPQNMKNKGMPQVHTTETFLSSVLHLEIAILITSKYLDRSSCTFSVISISRSAKTFVQVLIGVFFSSH